MSRKIKDSYLKKTNGIIQIFLMNMSKTSVIFKNFILFVFRAEVGSMFALPWFLTWYSHTLNNYNDVVRLYDYFLASEPLIPLYLIPEIIVYRQDVIFQTECEMACLHQKLSEVHFN